jgi:lipoprotein-anchoring transpeptidase ErfK/SrfK
MHQLVRRAVAGLRVMAAAGWLLPGLGGAAAAPVAVASPAPHASVAAYSGPSATARPIRLTDARPLASAAAYLPARRALYPGMHGAAVRRMQRRLAYLHYYPGAIDGTYGLATEEAVWAFKEVQGIQTSRHPNVVGHVMQRDLVKPRLPKVLVRHRARNRVEVNQNIEVLVLYHDNKIRLISHVSTGAGCLPGEGCGWITPTGNFRALSFFHGWETVPLGLMYNPVFFIGTRYAIHGEYDSSVPYYAASHGCVRVPYDVANVFHNMIRVPGTPIYIRR